MSAYNLTTEARIQAEKDIREWLQKEKKTYIGTSEKQLQFFFNMTIDEERYAIEAAKDCEPFFYWYLNRW